MKKVLLLAVAASGLLIGGAASAAELTLEHSLPMSFFAERMVANSQSASREHTDLARAVRTVTGISLIDIEKHGIFGGPNSIFRKPFG